MNRKIKNLVDGLVEDAVSSYLNESVFNKVKNTNSSDVEKEIDEKVMGKKYDVILYWEASVCDEVYAHSREEAIEIALKRNKKRIDNANKYVDLYDSGAGTCPEHRADLSDF